MENWMEKKWVSNGLWLLIGIPLFIATQLPMIALILGIENAWSNWTINSLVLGVTMLLVYLLWWFMKWSPLDSLDFSRIKGRDIGRNFLYFLLLRPIMLLGLTFFDSWERRRQLTKRPSKGWLPWPLSWQWVCSLL